MSDAKPIDDGGPALPGFLNIPGYGCSKPIETPQGASWAMYSTGLSLRDWFAGQALSSRGAYGANIREKELASECYLIADAMLAARKAKP